MRLGQLARKLDKKPQELVDYLMNEHQIELDNQPNTKVEGKGLDLILDSFKLDVIEDKVEDVIEANSPVLEEEEEEEEEEVVAELEIKETIIESNIETILVSDELEKAEDIVLNLENTIEVNDDVEEFVEPLIIENGVIKAPKTELDGPKVIGKIELPTIQRSVQFLSTNGNVTSDITEEIFEKRKTDKAEKRKLAIEAKKKRQNKKREVKKRRVLSDSDKKAHEQKINAKRQVELDKKRQENRKRHYVENVQKQQIVANKKRKQKEIEKSAKKPNKKEKLPEPTTLWGKFKRWLND